MVKINEELPSESLIHSSEMIEHIIIHEMN